MSVREYSDSYPTVEEVLESNIDEIPRLHKPVMLIALELSLIHI